MKNKIGLIILGSALLGSLVVSDIAFAAAPGFGRGNMKGRAPGIFGTVSAINGYVLTVTSKSFGQNATSTTYTVDATNATITKNGGASSLSAIVIGDTASVQGAVNGTNVIATAVRDDAMGHGMNQKPNVSGTVTSVSGNTITITSKMKRGGKTNATYTVDATNATITKNGANSSVSNIAVGDAVMIQGTVNGSSITATTIRDNTSSEQKNHRGAASIIQGNGQPVIGGNVTAINGPTITVTNKSSVIYIVDATNAAIEKGNATSSIAAIAIGDNVVIQGAVNGTSVVASSVIDQGMGSLGNNAPTRAPPTGSHPGFFGGIRDFFHNLFGFF
jgi:hypothetical protein